MYPKHNRKYKYMTSQFSPKVSEILVFSREEATRLASRSVGPEHLLLGIMRDKQGDINHIFSRMSVNMDNIKHELEDKVREDDITQPISTSELVLNDQANKLLKLAVLEARMQHSQIVDVNHLLLAILHDQNNNGAKEVLESNNITYQDMLAYLQKPSKPAEGMNLTSDDDYDDELDDDHRETHSHAKKLWAKRYLLIPLIHSLQTFAYVLAVTLVFGILFADNGLIGADKLSAFLDSSKYFAPFITSLIGLIPNCASSAVITSAYVRGAISFGAMTAGLISNAGVGLAILFKNTRKTKRNLLIMLTLYLIGSICGIIISSLEYLFIF